MRLFKRFENTDWTRTQRTSAGNAADLDSPKHIPQFLNLEPTRSPTHPIPNQKLKPRGLSIDTSSIFPSSINPSWGPGTEKARDTVGAPLEEKDPEAAEVVVPVLPKRFAHLKSAALSVSQAPEPSTSQPEVIYFSMTTPLSSVPDTTRTDGESSGFREALSSLAKLDIAAAVSPTSPYSAAMPSSVGPSSSYPSGSNSVFNFPSTPPPVPPLPPNVHMKRTTRKRRSIEGEGSTRDVRAWLASTHPRVQIPRPHSVRKSPKSPGASRRDRSAARKQTLRSPRSPSGHIANRSQTKVRPLPPIRTHSSEGRRAVHFSGPRPLRSQTPKSRPASIAPLSGQSLASSAPAPQGTPAECSFVSPSLSSSSAAGSARSVSSPPQLSSSGSTPSPSLSSPPHTPSALTSAFRMSIISSAYPSLIDAPTLPPGITSFEQFAALPGMPEINICGADKRPPLSSFATTAPLRISAKKSSSGRSTPTPAPSLLSIRSRSGSASSTNSELQIANGSASNAGSRPPSRNLPAPRPLPIPRPPSVRSASGTEQRQNGDASARKQSSDLPVYEPRASVHEFGARRLPAIVSPPATWIRDPCVSTWKDESVQAEIVFPREGWREGKPSEEFDPVADILHGYHLVTPG